MLDGFLRTNAALDVLMTVVIFLAVRYMLARFGIPKAASIAVVITVAFATLRLVRHGLSWADFGFRLTDSLATTLLLAVAAFLLTNLAVSLLTTPLANALELPQPAYSKLGELHGNLPYLLFMVVVIGWGAAAFGEELLFRGFLLNRLQTAFGGAGNIAPIVLAVLAQALLFGLGHVYLGARGAMNAGTVGLVFGLFYVLSGNNLWPLIIAHGLLDSVSLYALYAGLGTR